ncbi:MAG: penicillin-binding protein transpeptidase [Pseudonocardia sp.]|nr:penicillin-binding protein transpeptidase [Pseudonocardia sp.]
MLVLTLVVAALKLVAVQTVLAGSLSEEADKQRTTRVAIPAGRGDIVDRNGTPMAFTVEAKALVANPRKINTDRGVGGHARKLEIAEGMAALLGADEAALRTALDTDTGYVVLAPAVEPAQARAVRDRFPEISEEPRQIRRYPGGALAANIIGAASWNVDESKLHGLVGLENSRDNLLGGVDGFRVVDTAEGSNTIIPGSTRAEQAATPGSNLQLTVDADLQYTVQRLLTAYVTHTGAKGGSAVVMDAKTGEVLALANDKSFDPSNLSAADSSLLGNAAVTSPFEPGSVHKIITMAGALENGIARPDTVLTVPDHIQVGESVINDAWHHPTQHFTLTGVLAKSSNVGTLMTAQQLGPDRFADMLSRFGLGQATGVGLPGESAGQVPPRQDWSGSTFGNLPIGQGLSMTVLQMAGMYQAIANDGVRIAPRIIKSTVGPDGQRHDEVRPEGVRVVSKQTAVTLRNMLRAVTQKAPGQTGTGPQAAVDGYQVAGKTGTGQQVDPGCRCYSGSSFWITFAGMFPAADPRYVIGIMLDAPPGGDSAAPLFHDIAADLGQRQRVPVTAEPTPIAQLVVP